MRATRTLLWLGLLTLAGCKVMDMAGEIVALQHVMAKEFEDPNVTPQIIQKDLAITFAAKKYADMSPDEQAALARRAAEFVRDRYKSYGKLETIRVRFKLGGPGMTPPSPSDFPYTFATAELGAPAQDRR